MELLLFVTFVAAAGYGVYYLKKKRAEKKAFIKMTTPVEEVKAPDPEA